MLITQEEIFAKTDGGLDVILRLFPEAADCLSNKGKKFRLRGNEKTASASLKKVTGGVWVVTDFGGDQKPRNCIELVRYCENLDYKQAIEWIATRFNIVGEDKQRVINKAKISKRPADVDEEEGTINTGDVKNQIPLHELKVLFADKVLEWYMTKYPENYVAELNKVCAKHKFYSLNKFVQIKERQAIITESTETYPIFSIEGKGFVKIYQPLNIDKQYRFRYTGIKPKDYIFGYDRLVKEFNEFINSEENASEDDSEKRRKKLKLDHVIICSGERDSLNVSALGYRVIWLNSESATIDHKTFIELQKMCHGVYNLPDIDATGKREGHKNAMLFLDLKTIDLPPSLSNYKDWRGNPFKDVRDYLSRHRKSSFDNLFKTALQYRFWDEEPQFDKDGNFKKNNYVVKNLRMYNFLMKNGFYRLKFQGEKEGYVFIKITNYIVEKLKDNQVKSFINNFLADRAMEEGVRDTFYRSNQLSSLSLSNLNEIEIDFTDYDKTSQYFFFANKQWRVTKNGIDEFKTADITRYVWDDEVIDHNVEKLDEAFTIRKITYPDGSESYDIDIHRNDCLFFRYLINTSRIHWQKEFEVGFDTEEERLKYIEENRYNINGPRLTDEERHEQRLHLINKIYAIGYLLHRYKDESRPWAVWAMDAKLSEEGESHGGSGKSLCFKSLNYLAPTVFLNGRDPYLTENKHIFEQVTEYTDLVLIDDSNQYLKFDFFFPFITTDFAVNPKHAKSFTIPYKDSPKIIFTSNFGLRNLDPSTARRILYAAFSDFYHDNSSGEYKAALTPKDDFGKELFRDFSEDEWNLFFNTMAQCCRWFLNFDKINPPLNNVDLRNLLSEMGQAFKDWADVYFSEQSGKLDTLVPKLLAFEEFRKASNNRNLTSQRFMKSLKAWCKFYKFDLDPVDLRNKSGRIIRKIQKTNPDGTLSQERVSTEMLYIKTQAHLTVSKDENESDQTQSGIINTTNTLPF